MKFLIINGPNLNMVGIREPGLYGSKDYKALLEFIRASCREAGVECELYQSNHEGDLVDKIQAAYGNTDGIVINPGAYTHTSVALLDAVKSVSIPTVEVHISDVSKREDFRQVSYIRKAAVKTYMGLGFEGYRQAILFLKDYLTNGKKEEQPAPVKSNTVTVKASQSYDVIVEPGLLDRVGDYLTGISKASTAVLVCGDIVRGLYADRVIRSVEAKGIRVLTFVLPHGEQSKTPEKLFELLEFMAENGVTRSDILIALGGGVTGDLTGCAAAFYMRGIDFIQVPTTLLAAVDSSVGGKTAVDLKAGKNLAGAFKQPRVVLCDTDTLSTLPDDEFAAGMGEVIKYGVLCDEELFRFLETSDVREKISEIILRCVSIKRDVVMADEFDKGARASLNLGHTYAHAIEKRSDYTVKHGHAVAIGLVAVAKCAYIAGLSEEDIAPRIAALCERCGLPTSAPYPPDELVREITKDKKCSGSSITVVIPKRIGKTELVKMDIGKAEEFFMHAND